MLANGLGAGVAQRAPLGGAMRIDLCPQTIQQAHIVIREMPGEQFGDALLIDWPDTPQDCGPRRGQDDMQSSLIGGTGFPP